MRWFWIDRFEEFVRCRHATAVKAVTLAEEHLHDHFPGLPVMPNTLVLEGLAQTAGLLAADAVDFERQVVLVKVSQSTFHFDAVPGDVLRYRGEIVELNESGSLARATSRVGERLQAEAEFMFGPSRDRRDGAEAHVASGADVVARQPAHLRRGGRGRRQSSVAGPRPAVTALRGGCRVAGFASLPTWVVFAPRSRWRV